MSREIKFRAWDKEEKKFTEDLGIVIMLKGTVLGKYDLEAKNLIIQQFTGLKDKNDREIYEGDIIKIPDDWDEYGMNAGEIYEIFFNEGGFRLKPKYRKDAKGMWLEETDKFEVIGNIYENPEFLIN